MLLSGGFAGIAGMSEVLGLHHRLYNEFTSGYGFDAISIALLGKLHPLGVVFAALFFGALRVGANAMQHVVQIPIAIVYVIQGLAVLFILTDSFFQNYIIQGRKSRQLKRRNPYELTLRYFHDRCPYRYGENGRSPCTCFPRRCLHRPGSGSSTSPSRE